MTKSRLVLHILRIPTYIKKPISLTNLGLLAWNSICSEVIGRSDSWIPSQILCQWFMWASLNVEQQKLAVPIYLLPVANHWKPPYLRTSGGKEPFFHSWRLCINLAAPAFRDTQWQKTCVISHSLLPHCFGNYDVPVLSSSPEFLETGHQLNISPSLYCHPKL